MTTPQDGPAVADARREALVHKLSAMRQAAEAANDRLAEIKAAAFNPLPDHPVIEACDEATAQNDEIIATCNTGMIAVILDKPGFDAFLDALAVQTDRMKAETAQLDKTVEGLDRMKKAANVVTEVLGFLL